MKLFMWFLFKPRLPPKSINVQSVVKSDSKPVETPVSEEMRKENIKNNNPPQNNRRSVYSFGSKVLL